jgi:hypothetical protein
MNRHFYVSRVSAYYDGWQEAVETDEEANTLHQEYLQLRDLIKSIDEDVLLSIDKEAEKAEYYDTYLVNALKKLIK